MYQLKQENTVMFYKFHFTLGNLFGLEESDVEFVNTMTTGHEFKDTWFYKYFGLKNLLMS